MAQEILPPNLSSTLYWDMGLYINRTVLKTLKLLKTTSKSASKRLKMFLRVCTTKVWLQIFKCYGNFFEKWILAKNGHFLKVKKRKVRFF